MPWGPFSVSLGQKHIIHAIQNRQPTFLSLAAWIEIPFSDIAPSVMQAFLNEFVHLSSLLCQMDGLCLAVDSQPTSQSGIEQQVLLSLFTDLSARLDHWEYTLTTSSFSYERCHYFSPEADDDYDDESGHRPISYPNVTMANIFTHLWAFQIITLQEMTILTSALSETISSSPSPSSTSSPEDRAIVLARNISLSMDYLMKEDMGLFGPASSYFPLRVAWEVLKEGGDHFYGTHVKRSVNRLVTRGLLSAPTLVFGPELELH
ncbi:hypothetical protein N7481_006910 [Penicillium waksmanii]|uniref:uncharacterized protein n=1 Tax=Penicillium waksmanii TaxID=69791 RepID=UPI002548B767|nr:uncharacterized protein N7481_006910 [Penicillium waksmanii]KAJ5979612.1 hypothetical protein N7481_006910 [Penicillium waksmanii]